MKQSQIVKLGVFFELLLAVLYFLWNPKRSDFFISIENILIGIFAAVALFILNIFLVEIVKKKPEGIFFKFTKEVVHPLSCALDTKGALIISIAAGVGEELFFRGLLQASLGIIISSVLFAVLHFGTAIKTFFYVVILYFFVSMAFGFLYLYTNALIAPIVAHSLYDFLAIQYLKKQEF